MGSLDKKPLQILISGAGIAGPALAFWLSRLGHACTVIERCSSLRAHGQQIDIRLLGLETVKRMGILDDIRARTVCQPGVQFVDSDGNPFALFPPFKQGFVTDFEIMRGDLCKLLVEKTKDTTNYEFGLTVTAFENKSDCVNVTFSDDSTRSYDMVVAADGQGSKLREMLLRDEDPLFNSSRNLGVNIAYFTISRKPEDVDLATVYITSGQRAIMTRFHSETHGQGYLYTMARADQMALALKQGISKQKELFAEIFQGAGWQSGRLVNEMLESTDFHAQSSTQIQTKSWSKGRVVLIGDAGYSPTSFTGMGTTLALVGATILAGEISQSPDDLERAIASYENIYRPYVERAQKIPMGIPGVMHPKKDWIVKILQFFLRIVTLLKLERVLQTYVFRKDGWELPSYPKLKA